MRASCVPSDAGNSRNHLNGILCRTSDALPPNALVKRGSFFSPLNAGAVETKKHSAKAISMKTLLDNMPPEAAPATLRSEIAHLFLELPSGQQSELLGSQWEKIAGPEMIPVLRRIYDAAPETDGPARPIVATAVERLY